MCDMTHLHVWHDSFLCGQAARESSLSRTRLPELARICVTWLIHMCDMTHSHVWHDSFICGQAARGSSLTGCQDSFVCVWHDSFMYVTWLIHACDMIHSYAVKQQESRVCQERGCQNSCACVWHGSFIYVTWLIHMRSSSKRVDFDTSEAAMTHSHEWRDTFICVPWLI